YIQKSVEGIWRIRSNFIRIIACFWMICSLILSIGYCAKLYSIFAVPRFEDPIDTVAQLVNAATTDSHNVIVKMYSSLWNIYMHAGEENWIYYLLAQHMKR